MNGKDEKNEIEKDEMGKESEGEKVAENQQTSISLIVELMEKNFERFPMLEVIFDKFARTFTSLMRNITSDGISLEVEEVSSLRFKDYNNKEAYSKLMCIFMAKELDGRGVIFLDRVFLNLMLSILFGGRKVQGDYQRQTKESYSVIDKKVADYLIQTIFSSMQQAFDLISDINFSIDRYETNFKFLGISTPSEIVILAKIKIELEKKISFIEILFPKIMLGPLHHKLRKISASDNSLDINAWSDHFKSEAEHLEVILECVIGETIMSFKDLMQLGVNSVVQLDGQDQMEKITVNINGRSFFIAEAGKVNSQLAVKIKEILK